MKRTLLLITLLNLQLLTKADPAISSTASQIKLNLKAHYSESKQLTGFYADIVSYPCHDSVCEIMRIRLHWDLLGRYLKFELKPKHRLSKKDHKPFTKAEYFKLHCILLDQNSYFRYVPESQLIKHNTEAGAYKLDAVASATVNDRNIKTVDGAVKTCYTLWQIANIFGKKKVNQFYQNYFKNDSEIQTEDYYDLLDRYQAANNSKLKIQILRHLDQINLNFDVADIEELEQNKDPLTIYLLAMNFSYNDFYTKETKILQKLNGSQNQKQLALNYFLQNYNPDDYPSAVKAENLPPQQ